MSITLRMTHGQLTDNRTTGGRTTEARASDGHAAGAPLFVVRLQQVLSRVFLSERAGVGEQRLLLRGVGIEEV
ncbi:hypothetical protein [Pseudoclavibacter sp. VKM Ac-2888]|uniref:hypothetical protein n=1 Tax=Pseudoclavibacter sp. VKM Ac-2888 TaxID=2783830 RepID=UPI001889F495|nr:hypothetical protein [Pseudoclavibacter sp. VKM Ac-2888]MBF4550201.1 hypothetical protein [Pseudoclavibacter sp. VKM Ac-2888]